MSDSDAAPSRSAAGGTTAGQGTPVPVDVAVPSRVWADLGLFLAGPVIWSVHFLVVYLVVEAGCSGDGPGLNRFDPPVPQVVTLVATVVAALACLVSTGWAYRRWRAQHEAPDGSTDAAPASPGAPLVFAGFLLSLLGFITVLFVGMPVLFLQSCGP